MKFENSSDSATKSCCSAPLSQSTAVFSQNVPPDFKIMNDNALVTTFYLKHAVLVSCKKKLGVGVPQAKIKCGRISGDQKSQSIPICCGNNEDFGFVNVNAASFK